MKLKIWLSTIILLSSTLVKSQNQSLVKVESNEIIEMSAEQCWSIVNGWKNLNQLAPDVVVSTRVIGKELDSEWTINLSNGGTIKEKMVYYNASEKTMSYIMTETPMPIQDYTAIIKVEPYGISKSLISFYTECKTSEENYTQIKNNFQTFQENYLSNIKSKK